VRARLGLELTLEQEKYLTNLRDWREFANVRGGCSPHLIAQVSQVKWPPESGRIAHNTRHFSGNCTSDRCELA